MTFRLQASAAILYDLDNCLFPTASFPASIVNTEVDKLRALNVKEGFVAPDVLERALQDCWVLPLDVVARKHAFPVPLTQVTAQLFSTMPVPETLSPYPDIIALPTYPGMRFLVTTGYRDFQTRKIAALNIAHFFDGVYIDGIDDDVRKGKEAIFREIIADYHLDPNEVLVIGDNPTSEIAAGNRIGLTTIQILRTGIKKGSNAHYYIQSLFDLPAVLNNDIE